MAFSTVTVGNISFLSHTYGAFKQSVRVIKFVTEMMLSKTVAVLVTFHEDP